MITTKGGVLMTLVILLIVGFSAWRWWGKIAGQPAAPTTASNAQVVVNDKNNPPPADAKAAAAVDVSTKLLIGTNEAKLVDAQAIPPAAVKPSYKKALKDGKLLVKFPINVWPGWAPIITANNGLEANDNSVFFKKYGFYVDLIIVDDPVRNRDLFASGENPIMWGTLDMIAMFANSLSQDARAFPRVPMQVDFSDGGDGIVARNNINSINDLRPVNGQKRKGILAQNSPSHFFVLSLIRDVGISYTEIDWRWAATAMDAAKIFVQDPSFDFFVGWAPDIYTVSENVKNTKLILSSSSANRRIADVWAVRQDFYQENPQVVDNMIRGILEGIEMVRKETPRAAQLMAKAYGLPLEDATAMIGKDGGIVDGDAHLTNYRENEKFFLDPRNPANFETIWDMACYVYKSVNAIDKTVPAGKIKLTEPLIRMKDEYKEVPDMSVQEFTPDAIAKAVEVESGAAMTKAVQIQFAPNSFKMDPAYDTNLTATVASIGELVGSFGAAAIVIEGNVDASRKGNVPEDLVRDFSNKRAMAVKNHILSVYTNFNPLMFRVKGNGWNNPLPNMFDPTNPDHNRANRRVEVKVFPIEG